MKLAALVLTAAMSAAVIGLPAPGSAGTQTNETTGATLCKGDASCQKLKANCGGTYTDYTDPQGTSYGKCQPSSASSGRNVLMSPVAPPPPGQRGLRSN